MVPKRVAVRGHWLNFIHTNEDRRPKRQTRAAVLERTSKQNTDTGQSVVTPKLRATLSLQLGN